MKVNFDTLKTSWKAIQSKVMPMLAKKAEPVVVPEPIKAAVKIEPTTQEIRAAVIGKYLGKPITTMPGADVHPYMSVKMLADVTNPKVAGAKVTCYPARTVVDMSKENGSFVRKVYTPDGSTVTRETIIKPDKTTKSIVFESPQTGKSVTRNPQGEITRSKQWTYGYAKQTPWGNGLGMGVDKKANLSHKKFYKDGKWVAGETSIASKSGTKGPYGDWTEYVDRDQVTKYTIPGKRQSMSLVSKYKKGSAIPGVTTKTPPTIDALKDETLKFLEK